jgi:Transposase domain (DUF772)
MHPTLKPSSSEPEPSTGNGHAAFLSTMDRILPWTKLLGLTGTIHNDCPPTRLARLLRIYLVQGWFGLSDRGAEAALHDSISIREFVGVDRANVLTPDASEIHDFRESLENRGIRRSVKATVDHYLLANRYFLREGSSIAPVLGRYDDHSGFLGRLAEHFDAISPPYELSEILRFNAIYREIFTDLNPAERQRAEQFVERLIEGAASPAYVPRIFGVV